MIHEIRADAVSLEVGQDGHWRQTHPLDIALPALNDDRCEEDVADDSSLVFGHQRKVVRAGGSQGVDQRRFGTALECHQIEVMNRLEISRFFTPYRDHPEATPARLIDFSSEFENPKFEIRNPKSEFGDVTSPNSGCN